MRALTGPEIVGELDRSIIGHEKAKRILATGIRNRWRRLQAQRCEPDWSFPLNFLISGPSGSGKSSLVRAAAQAIDAPLARLNALQMTDMPSLTPTAETTFEALIEHILPRFSTQEQAVDDVSSTSVLLIEGLDRLFPLLPADETHNLQLEALQHAFQRFLLGPALHTRYGDVHTCNLLVVAETQLPSSRLIETWPELHPLFPYRVELDGPGEGQLGQILANPASSPVRYYTALLATEGLHVDFTQEALEAIAREASEQNQRIEDTGARRLNSVVETVLDTLLFDPASVAEDYVMIDAGYVASRLMVDSEDDDLADFIL